MGRDRSDAGQFEWVNAWAETRQAGSRDRAEPSRPPLSAELSRRAESQSIAPSRRAPARSADARYRRDRARARRARGDAGRGSSSKRRTQALTLVPSRTTDPVPVVIGGVLALVMLTVFGAAAAMTKLAR